jgi:hypothetical protein
MKEVSIQIHRPRDHVTPLFSNGGQIEQMLIRQMSMNFQIHFFMGGRRAAAPLVAKAGGIVLGGGRDAPQ